MPINPKLKAHLEQQTMDEGYRTRLIATLEDAPPDVQNLWMSQADYTRQVNQFKETQNTWKVTADDFYTKSNASIEGWKAELKKANDSIATANARIAELEAGGGTPRTPAQEDAVAAEIKGLKNVITTLESKIGTGVTKEDLDKAYQSAVGFIGDQLISINEIGARHQEVFGKRMTKEDTNELIKFANEESARLGYRITLDDAYDRKHKDEIQKKHDDDVAKKAIEADRTTRQVPTGGEGGVGPGAPEQGPLQQRLGELRNREAGAKTGTGYATWQEAAAAGADELVKEGKY